MDVLQSMDSTEIHLLKLGWGRALEDPNVLISQLAGMYWEKR